MFTISNLGRKIRFLRKEQNMTQEELAGNEFTKSYISLIERGKINPSIKALNYIAEKLNKPVSVLLDSTDSIVDSQNMYKISHLIEEGTRLVDSFEFQRAYSLFSRLHENIDDLTNFHKGIVHYYMGYIMFKKETNEKSFDFIKKSVKYLNDALRNFEDNNPKDNLEIFIKLAESYYILNNKEKSLKHFIEAKEYEEEYRISREKYYYILRNITILFTQKGSYSIAIDYLKKIIEMSKEDEMINKNVLSAYITLSRCYFYLNQYEDSLQVLRKILPVYEYLIDNPKDHSGIYLRMADILIKQGEYESALENINKSIKIAESIKEKDMKLYTILYNKLMKIRILFNNKNMDEACEKAFTVLNEIKVANREDNQYISISGDTNLLLGEICMEKGEYESSKTYFENALKLYNKIKAYYKLPQAYKYLGNVHIKLNEPDKAQEYYEKAFELLAKNKNV